MENLNTLSLTLRSETIANHRRAEKQNPFFKSEFSLEDYKTLLKNFFPYFKSYEMAMKERKDLNVPHFEYRLQKSKALERDLTLIDPSFHAEEFQLDRTVFKNSAEAMGMMYVIEGSTMGGQIIAKELQKRLSLKPEELSFYYGYGDGTHPFWCEFKKYLDDQDLTSAEVQDCIARARQTFTELGRLMQTH